MRRTLLILLATLLAFAFAATKPDVARAQGDNAAVAINTKDGTSIFRIAFKIVRVNQEVVDQSNAAVAFASCIECQAIAVAFQVVLVFSDPDVVTPENLAIAVNYECESCVAFASAYQFVLGTGGPVHFTAEGNRRLAAIRHRLQELRKGDLTLDQLVAELEQINGELADILANEVVPAGKPKKPTEDESETETTTTEPTTTEEATTTEPATTTTQ
jgi:putative peptide zinc metalloprotease protein